MLRNGGNHADPVNDFMKNLRILVHNSITYNISTKFLKDQ